MKPLNLSYPAKLSIFGASIGIALIAVLASYFRRKRRKIYKDVTDLSLSNGPTERPSSRTRGKSPLTSKNLNGEIPSSRSSLVSSNFTSLAGSTVSVNSIGSTNTITLANFPDVDFCTPEQLCELGMECLHQTIEYWENALDRIEADPNLLENPSLIQLQSQFTVLLERAHRIQDAYEESLFQEVQTNVAVESAMKVALEEMDKAFEKDRRKLRSVSSANSMEEESSDIDSFVSARDVADLSDLEDQRDSFHHLALYEAALLELEHGSIPYRSLRTKMVHCTSDTEFLAKLHCIRLAMQELFKDETNREYFADSGRQLLSDILVWGDRDPDDFKVTYEDLLNWVRNADNWPLMEEELRGRGVKVLSFYDVVIEFILFDAFDDLESPPSSVTAVVQNRWLSNGFKETALSTAVWSVLKAKRKMLKFPRGFIAHFYALSEHTSPVLAWGFLGPDGHLKDLCLFFKDQVLGFMRDAFSFNKVRYTTVDHLAEDIMRLARSRISQCLEKLSLNGEDGEDTLIA